MRYTDRENTADLAAEIAARRRRPLPPGLARAVRCDDARIYVTLEDGREVSLPLTRVLREARASDRAAGRVTDDGLILSWETVDEDIGVHTFLGLSEADIERFYGEQRRSRTRVRP